MFADLFFFSPHATSSSLISLCGHLEKKKSTVKRVGRPSQRVITFERMCIFKSSQVRVQPAACNTENMGRGSKHSPKWVNIWQPKPKEFGDMSVLGAYFWSLCEMLQNEAGSWEFYVFGAPASLAQPRERRGHRLNRVSAVLQRLNIVW